MRRFECSSCKASTIPWWDKYKADLWLDIYCPQCGARLTPLPIVLALLWMAYIWNAAWWFSLYYFAPHLWYFPALVIIHLMLDSIGVFYVPLITLRPRPSKA